MLCQPVLDKPNLDSCHKAIIPDFHQIFVEFYHRLKFLTQLRLIREVAEVLAYKYWLQSKQLKYPNPRAISFSIAPFCVLTTIRFFRLYIVDFFYA